MRALVQRVTSASVSVGGDLVCAIETGLVVLLGVTHTDTPAIAAKLADKAWRLRIFDDDDGVMNESAADRALPLLVVSQFTLYGDTTRGRRPSWVNAAPPDQAEPLVEEFVGALRALGAAVETGRFRADMHVALVNDGPVTLLLEV
ncbi:MAG TPA: D-aminoacyl-tRNA deacylase [Acidimicrobiia bacterium]